MKFNNEILPRYVSYAPMALAFERYLECQVYLTLKMDKPILDLGCGDGLFASMLFDEEIDTGIDPNPRELKRARLLCAYSELIECKGDMIPKPNGEYKTIFSNSVLEHIPDLSPVLDEVWRLLDSNGIFYFSAPSDQFDRFSVVYKALTKMRFNRLAEKFRIFYNHFWRHYHFYSLKDWRQLVQDHGFEIIRSFTFDPEETCTLNDLISPLGFFQFLNKKLFNHWTLFPGIRRKLLGSFTKRYQQKLETLSPTMNGGLVFFSVRKVDR